MWIARIKNLKNTRGVTYLDIAKACKVSRSRVSKWFNGDAMPDATSIDIMYAKFFPGLYDADYLEGLFSHAYEEKHNVDGQIGICEANKEEHHDKVNKVVPVTLHHPALGLINAYYDPQRELLYIAYMTTGLAKVLGITWEEDDE